jgi:lipopolysaccharide core heptose(I) kinase
MIYIRDDLQALFPEKEVDAFLVIEGEVYKHVVSSRRTLKFERHDREFFLKAHWGVGWREIIKDLTSLRLPVVGARNEWLAIQKMHDIGIATMITAAYGETGINPARRKSFLVTDALQNTEDLEHWLPAQLGNLACGERVRRKRAVLSEVARMARVMHGHGVNHRDFYLCHFRIDPETADQNQPVIYLMDLHRAQIRHKVPLRWRVKDIAGLLYSSLYSCQDLHLSSRDYIRFIEAYSSMSWRDSLKKDQHFWMQVMARVIRTYKADHKSIPELPAFLRAGS